MALFELKQDYGNEAEGLPPPPTFKDCAAADIDTVFFNGNEHADRHIIDGKDVGGYESAGGSYGSLSSYCGLWVNGSYQPLSHDFEEAERVEPTETEDGYVRYVCSKCHEESEEVLPATGKTDPEQPDPEQPEQPDPGNTDNPDTPDPGGGDKPNPGRYG